MTIIQFKYADLIRRDEEVLKIEEIIEAKRNMLIEKQKKLRFISKQNIFLDAVKDDYAKYNNYIIKQKQDQMKALQVLNYYINDLTRTGNLTKQNIEDSKYEQRKIVHEIRSLQKNLDKIISDTNNINHNLKRIS